VCCWCEQCSDKKATEIPSELITVSAESQVMVVNLSRNCLTALPPRSVQSVMTRPDTECTCSFTSTEIKQEREQEKNSSENGKSAR